MLFRSPPPSPLLLQTIPRRLRTARMQYPGRGLRVAGGRRRQSATHCRRLRCPPCGAPCKEAPRAKPGPSQQRKEQDGGDNPSQPVLLRHDRRRAAGPDRYALAVTDGQSIFRNSIFLIKPEVSGNSSHESSIEDSAGELIPLLEFDGPQEARGNARGGGDFLQSDAPHFPFAL